MRWPVAPPSLEIWPAATGAAAKAANHWVRDACMREDQTRSRNYNLNCNLAALRVGLVALKADLHPEPSWPELQERCQHNPNIPFRALLKHRAK